PAGHVVGDEGAVARAVGDRDEPPGRVVLQPGQGLAAGAGDAGQVVRGVVAVAEVGAVRVVHAGQVAGAGVAVLDGLPGRPGDLRDPAGAVLAEGDRLAGGGVHAGAVHAQRGAARVGLGDQPAAGVQDVDVPVEGGQPEPGRRVQRAEQVGV